MPRYIANNIPFSLCAIVCIWLQNNKREENERERVASGI